MKRKDFLRVPVEEIPEDRIMFYDTETDHQYAPYAKLKTISVQYGFTGRPIMVDRASRRKEFRKALRDPHMLKVSFNGINFDDVVLPRHGYKINALNRHDVFLMFKAIAPSLPAFSQKFAAFYYLGDPHFPEHEILTWCKRNDEPMWKAPRSLLNRYNQHDVKQLVDLFRVAWDIIIRPEHWKAYLLDNFVGEPLLEMETEGGLYIDGPGCWRGLQRLQKIIQQQTQRALELTMGVVSNPNSSKQLSFWFRFFDELELEMTEGGEFCVKKSVLVSLKDTNPLADCAYKIREANGTIKYFENYLNALADETYNEINGPNWIPTAFSVSSARPRRFTSSSYYRLNFQNANEHAKEVQIVPPGQLGFFFDATQIENVVHIYESDDHARRQAYEDNPNWNEYVWLANEILGTDLDKAELDNKELHPFPAIPHWSFYKGYKTGKLAINFGMGINSFCTLYQLERDMGEETFDRIHTACPAIKQLQQRVACDLRQQGYVSDVFGHRYTGSVSKAYKVVAYLIQGCGTGSLPKAQIRANWESLRRFDKRMPARIAHSSGKCGLMCGTTHDENGGRIDLRLGSENILQLLQKMHFNMTEKFSPLFDDIPLRSKCYLTKTNNKKVIEVDPNKPNDILQIIKGDPCPCCNATGIIKTDAGKKEDCEACRGLGYVS